MTKLYKNNKVQTMKLMITALMISTLPLLSASSDELLSPTAREAKERFEAKYHHPKQEDKRMKIKPPAYTSPQKYHPRAGKK